MVDSRRPPRRRGDETRRRDQRRHFQSQWRAHLDGQLRQNRPPMAKRRVPHRTTAQARCARSRSCLSPDGTIPSTLTEEGVGRLWKVPTRLPVEPRQVELWAQVMTGKEIDELNPSAISIPPPGSKERTSSTRPEVRPSSPSDPDLEKRHSSGSPVIPWRIARPRTPSPRLEPTRQVSQLSQLPVEAEDGGPRPSLIRCRSPTRRAGGRLARSFQWAGPLDVLRDNAVERMSRSSANSRVEVRCRFAPLRVFRKAWRRRRPRDRRSCRGRDRVRTRRAWSRAYGAQRSPLQRRRPARDRNKAQDRLTLQVPSKPPVTSATGAWRPSAAARICLIDET